ncbi:hypothetical protein V1505DRAFT_381807 [Lipomyces doorenjongii]
MPDSYTIRHGFDRSHGDRRLRKVYLMLWMSEFHCRTAILFYNNESPKFGIPGNTDHFRSMSVLRLSRQ